MARKIRIECEQRTRSGGVLIDQRTGKQAWFYRGEAIEIEIALFESGRMLTRSDLSSIIINIRNAAGSALINQITISPGSMSGSITAQQWRQGTAALAVISIVEGSTAVLPAGMLTMEIKAISNSVTSVYASGTMESVTLVGLTTGTAPAPSPPEAYTKEEADALFATIASITVPPPSQTPGAVALLQKADWMANFGSGQSNATGADALPLAHDSAFGIHLTFANGPLYPTGSNLLSTRSLYETASGSIGESPCSGMGEGITHFLRVSGDDDRITLHATNAVGGQAIGSFAPGSAHYLALKATYDAGKARATAAGKSYACSTFWWIQGESDAYGGTTKAAYKAALSDIITGVRTDLGNPQSLILQTSAYNATNSGPALAQVEITEEFSDVHFVTPTYFLPMSAGAPDIHFSTSGNQEIGMRLARAWDNLYRGNKVESIRLLCALQEGEANVILSMHVPTKPLQFNTTRVPLTTDKGFKIVDTVGTVPIGSVAVENESRIRIVTSRAIVGAATISYALAYNTTAIINSGSGNLTDSTNEKIWLNGSKVALEHWCPAFYKTLEKLVGPNFELALAGNETAAWEHWDLKVNSSSLTGLINARTLTPVATVNYNADAVVCPAGLGGYLNGLRTSLADKFNYTLAIVYKRPVDVPGDYILIAGNHDVALNTGAGLFSYGSSVGYLNIRSNVVSFSASYATAGKAVGDWCWAVIRDTAGALASKIGGGAALAGTGGARTLVTSGSGQYIAVGNSATAYSNCDNELQIAEVVLFNSALSESEINDLYIRSKSRMSARGISI